MSVNLEKNEFRKSARANLMRLAKFKAKCSHYQATKTLLNLINFTNSKKILLYLPLDYEVDVLKMRRNLSRRCEIFAPFMVGLSLKMVRLRLPFVTYKFHVRQPSGRKMDNVRLDMAVVPAIGVDGAMARIGHGKGFYDRFFDTLPVKPKLIVFLEVKDFYTKDVLSQAHDAVGDFYITPSKNYIKRGINDRGFNRLRSRCGGHWSRVSLCKKDK
jgi:5-formyltetrahydrofolate cyclo-ligase